MKKCDLGKIWWKLLLLFPDIIIALPVFARPLLRALHFFLRENPFAQQFCPDQTRADQENQAVWRVKTKYAELLLEIMQG